MLKIHPLGLYIATFAPACQSHQQKPHAHAACRHLAAADLAALSAQNKYLRKQAGQDELWEPLFNARYAVQMDHTQLLMW